MKVIYKITNTVTNKVYVGSTKDFTKRKKTHLRTLRKGTHHCIYLQRSFTKHGEVFEFSVLKELSEDENLFEFEQYFIDTLKPGYNIGSVGGGDNLTNNPNREVIIAKRTATNKAIFESMSTEERLERYSHFGEDNPNWKGGHKWFCACGTKIKEHNTTCMSCKPIKGEDNPFYGKTHSDETKAKLSALAKGRKGRNTKAVYAEGTIYSSMTDASEAYNLTIGAMSYRVSSKADKWSDFYIITEGLSNETTKG